MGLNGSMASLRSTNCDFRFQTHTFFTHLLHTSPLIMEKAIDTYEKQKSGIMYYGLFGLECTTTLMGRLMYLNNYKPMVDLYNDNQIRELIDFYGPTSFETVEAVYNFSKGYLIHLKK
jgi:hypothetical protein